MTLEQNQKMMQEQRTRATCFAADSSDHGDLEFPPFQQSGPPVWIGYSDDLDTGYEDFFTLDELLHDDDVVARPPHKSESSERHSRPYCCAGCCNRGHGCTVLNITPLHVEFDKREGSEKMKLRRFMTYTFTLRGQSMFAIVEATTKSQESIWRFWQVDGNLSEHFALTWRAGDHEDAEAQTSPTGRPLRKCRASSRVSSVDDQRRRKLTRVRSTIEGKQEPLARMAHQHRQLHSHRNPPARRKRLRSLSEPAGAEEAASGHDMRDERPFDASRSGATWDEPQPDSETTVETMANPELPDQEDTDEELGTLQTPPSASFDSADIDTKQSYNTLKIEDDSDDDNDEDDRQFLSASSVRDARESTSTLQASTNATGVELTRMLAELFEEFRSATTTPGVTALVRQMGRAARSNDLSVLNRLNGELWALLVISRPDADGL